MTDEPGTELAPSNNSLVQVKIGNREYSMVQSRRCGICMHPGRFAIEEKLMLNFGYPAIARYVSQHEITKDDGTTDTWPEITATQIKHHREAGHISLNAEMVQELTRRRAEAQGIDLESYTGQFVDQVVASKIILQQGIEALIKGDIKVDTKDVIAVSKLLNDLEAANSAHADVDQYQELFLIFLQAVQKEMPQETFKRVMLKISQHPTFKAIQQKRTIDG